jgi:hypothetical protein
MDFLVDRANSNGDEGAGDISTAAVGEGESQAGFVQVSNAVVKNMACATFSVKGRRVIVRTTRPALDSELAYIVN